MSGRHADANRDFSYDALPTRVVFGVGARRRVAEELARLGVRRTLLIAAREQNAPAEEVSALMGSRAAGRFADVVQHVPVEKADAARALARSLGADAVLTLGGGSATGFGKAVKLEIDVPHLAIPTSYAGSEMTPIWGLSRGARKQTGRDPRVQPDVVLYDPELTLTLPARIAGPSGMNALAHCVEALYGPGANPLTSLQALEGIRVLSRALPAVVARPDDLAARSEALYGAHLAGCALSVAGTALHHKTCHVLGGMFDLDHADSNAVILPHALRYNEPAIADAYARIGEALGARDAAQGLADLARAIGAPTSLAAIGMPADGVAKAAEQIAAEARANVRPPDSEGIAAMLDDALHGRPPGRGL